MTFNPADYLRSLKQVTIIITLACFALSTLVMPYANFDDTHSLQAVYNHCLSEDADMNFLEFVGEKLLVAGFDPDEDKEEKSEHPQKPVSGDLSVQIHSGALYQPVVREACIVQPEPVTILSPVVNTTLLSNDFRQDIFHPPSALV